MSCIVGYNSRPFWWNQVLFGTNQFVSQNEYDDVISHDKDDLEFYEDNEIPEKDTEMYVHDAEQCSDKRHDKGKF